MTDEWMSPRLREVTAQFRTAAVEATQACREASAAARQMTQRDVTSTPEFQQFERAVSEHLRSGKSGQGARELQDKIDRGELTWRQIGQGEVDQEVRQLYEENLSQILTGIDAVYRKQSEELSDQDDDTDDDGPVFRGVYRAGDDG